MQNFAQHLASQRELTNGGECDIIITYQEKGKRMPFMKRLGVLYACDENYAPWAGISMYSLFESNREIEALTVYCVTDRVADATREKLAKQAERYGRELVFVDAASIIEQIKALNIPSYRGSYTTNFRLFFHTFVGQELERLLYVDCDTLITGSLAPLLTLDIVS